MRTQMHLRNMTSLLATLLWAGLAVGGSFACVKGSDPSSVDSTKKNDAKKEGHVPTEGGELTDVRVDELRFSQLTISPSTSDGIPIEDLASSMAEAGWKGEPIEVVRLDDGRLTTLDHRRVVAALEAKLETVPAKVHTYYQEIRPEVHKRRFELNRKRLAKRPDRVTVKGRSCLVVPWAKPEIDASLHRDHLCEQETARTWGEAVLARSAYNAYELAPSREELSDTAFPLRGSKFVPLEEGELQDLLRKAKTSK